MWMMMMKGVAQCSKVQQGISDNPSIHTRDIAEKAADTDV